ncbi:HAD family hydrolase [Cohnella caldifontis]|uniref:HAD family hydrolase n=1 Tax=Cohnella caldifontis TaxID=3027471 RepID=UPI0023EADE72|nr:HAD family hydrolase [Cohnella sp. YIM B05605]
MIETYAVRFLTVPEAMIFDLDGTLFRTETLLLPAYRQTFAQLKKEKLYVRECPPEQRFIDSLGLLLEDIWKNVLPDQPVAVHERANELLLAYQLEGLKAGIGQLYPGVRETLRELREAGVRLFVASNGLEPYVRGVVEAKGLSGLFEGIYSAGGYRTASKADLVRLLLSERGVGKAWMVGDRVSDVEAGKRNGLTVIGCDYAGFHHAGELEQADRRIGGFPQLLSHYRAALV